MRVSTTSLFSRVLLGLRSGQYASLRAQEQLASGRRILRASDDPAGTARSLAVRRQLARTARYQEAIGAGRAQLDLASSTLQNSSELLTRSRELLLQAMNGTLTDDDRRSIATELEQIREQLLSDANLQVDGNHVFGGTAVGRRPFEELSFGGFTKVVYQGNRAEQEIQAGDDVTIAITAAGDLVYGRSAPGRTVFDGLTGAGRGLTADEGTGYGRLIVRHDSTDAGTLGTVGIALVNGGSGDTLLGSNGLEIDPVANTIRLGNGPALPIPEPGERGDVVVRNENGGELHLDLSGWSGAAYSGNVTGNGSISLDGDTFTALDFVAEDLELRNDTFGQVLHVDTTAILRAGTEMVSFGDTVNPFDLLQAIVADLRNPQELSQAELGERLDRRLDTLDRVHDDLLVGLGAVGARAARLVSSDVRQGELELQLQGRLSRVEDADLAEVALDLTRSQMILELAQSAGARLIQTSLLDFIR